MALPAEHATAARAWRVPSWLLAPGLTLFGVSTIAFLGLARVIGLGGYDLSVYLMGGTDFREGRPVYDAVMQSQYGSGYFTYPPVTLMFFGPLSRLSPATVHGLMILLTVAALLGVVWLTLRLLGGAPNAGLVGVTGGIAGAAMWLQPVYDTLDQGQVNIVLMCLVLADVAFDGRTRWPTGVLIGVAAAVKITPAIFILYLLLARRFRAAATAALTWFGLTAFGFLVAWSDSVRFWFHATFADSARVANPLTPASVFNQSLHGIALRFAGDHAGAVIWVVLAIVVGALGLTVAVVANRMEGPVPGLIAAAITGLLISPLTWHEHWVWIVPAVIFLADAARRVQQRWPTLAAAVPCAVAVPFLMWPQPTIAPDRIGPASILSPARHLWEDEGSHNPVVALLGTAYVTTGLLLLAAGAVALYRVYSIDIGQFIRTQLAPDAASRADAKAALGRLSSGLRSPGGVPRQRVSPDEVHPPVPTKATQDGQRPE